MSNLLLFAALHLSWFPLLRWLHHRVYLSHYNIVVRTRARSICLILICINFWGQLSANIKFLYCLINFSPWTFRIFIYYMKITKKTLDKCLMSLVWSMFACLLNNNTTILQRSISSLISSYSTSGYMDELRSKWYSSLPCARSAHDAYRPQALGVSAVAGVFILLGFGILAGCLILVLEHMVYKYALPGLRRQPKGTIWRSPNMMFFSQV